MKEKNLQKYPEWLKDEAHREYVERAMERIWIHKARVVLNNERLFMIDWQGKNSVTVDEMHYILDKEHGVFTLYGDWGEAVAYFSHRIEVEDLLYYLHMCSCNYFVEKIVAGNPYVIDPELGAQDIEEEMKEIIKSYEQEWGKNEAVVEEAREDMETMIELYKDFGAEVYGTNSLFLELWDKYFTERDYEIGKRVSNKVYLWVMGFFMACDDAGLIG
nr:MAG TPA: hypothetical protein [Caudoviricetes sp.]